MKRRNFLKHSTIAGLPLVLGGVGLSANSFRSPLLGLNNDSDRILVIVRLNGGNDGLNMMVPLDQYDNLASVRSNILLPEKKLLPINDTIGFHPELLGLKDLYDNGHLGIIQNVGYPNQNRSHFRSTDIWTSASPADKTWHSGWLGRFLEKRYPGYPAGFPNSKVPHPLAITMGNSVSLTCQGLASNYSVVIDDPFALRQNADDSGDLDFEDSYYGSELDFLHQTIGMTGAYREPILEAASCGNNLESYPEDNLLARQLKNVALLISGGLNTKIYIVSQSGYDTHGNQVVKGDPTKGDHALLLKELSEAIACFQKDIKSLGIQDRVVGLTFSEFGRRIRSNDSLGTDHGTAAPMLFFGSCILPQILGKNPVIDPNVDKMSGVPMEFDFRDVYGSILMSLFEVDRGEVQEILHQDFSYLPLV